MWHTVYHELGREIILCQAAVQLSLLSAHLGEPRRATSLVHLDSPEGTDLAQNVNNDQALVTNKNGWSQLLLQFYLIKLRPSFKMKRKKKVTKVGIIWLRQTQRDSGTGKQGKNRMQEQGRKHCLL